MIINTNQFELTSSNFWVTKTQFILKIGLSWRKNGSSRFINSEKQKTSQNNFARQAVWHFASIVIRHKNLQISMDKRKLNQEEILTDWRGKPNNILARFFLIKFHPPPIQRGILIILVAKQNENNRSNSYRHILLANVSR